MLPCLSEATIRKLNSRVVTPPLLLLAETFNQKKQSPYKKQVSGRTQLFFAIQPKILVKFGKILMKCCYIYTLLIEKIIITFT